MKLNLLSLSNSHSKNESELATLSWSSHIKNLYTQGSKKNTQKNSPTLLKLQSIGVNRLYDLLWIFPLHLQPLPPLRSFDFLKPSELFLGRGKIINIKSRPLFYRRSFGKKKSRGPLLSVVDVYVKDELGPKILHLKWFNAYPSVITKLENSDHIEFSGMVSNISKKQGQYQNQSQGQLQIVNPKFKALTSDSISKEQMAQNELAEQGFKIEYPTLNSIPGKTIQKIIDKIPLELWDKIPETLPREIISKHSFIPLALAFKTLHGKAKHHESFAKNRIIYEEFFNLQLKIYLRRQSLKRPHAQCFAIGELEFKELKKLYPYELTHDQAKVMEEIRKDLSLNKPMMRLIQGDVGCGKTTVAILTALLIFTHKSAKGQVALMCPTEALALQHYASTIDLIKNTPLKMEVKLLLGSTPAKDKKTIIENLENGSIDLIIGTHSLFQENIVFKNLALAIIDEQHKFGVNQRVELLKKGQGTHCLIMSATPIPRSLSLTRYGDLDISIIKSMPAGRKGHKTRIVSSQNFPQFLNFIKTRLSLAEQIYIVVPAIEEGLDDNELENDKVLHNLHDTFACFKKYFPESIIAGLHGKMKPEEKAKTFLDFKNHKINILIATSVIEVGINVTNATVMAIFNPERFGLSSLHQLRGRIGRGDKPGFCFLVLDENPTDIALKRLKVIEETQDGFKIAEEDLKIRGEGDLFGTEQSGEQDKKYLANIVEHSELLYLAKSDIEDLLNQNHSLLTEKLERLSLDLKILTAI